MATIVIGDIHGNLAELCDVLSQVGEEAVEGDVVVFLGDYIDRGDRSRACIDVILAFRDESPAEVICLRGNHEDWLLQTLNDFTRHSWLRGMDGLSTIRSYSADAERAVREAMASAGLQLYVSRCKLPYEIFFQAMPATHHAFLSQLALYTETRDCICTHAGLDPNVLSLGDRVASSSDRRPRRARRISRVDPLEGASSGSCGNLRDDAEWSTT